MSLPPRRRRAMLSTMRAIGYVRVSTDKQADHGVSLEAQEAKIRAMAVVQGAEIIELIVEGGESAKNLNRPGMERLLALGCELFIELGPGGVLAGLLRRTRKDAVVVSVSDADSARAASELLRADR